MSLGPITELRIMVERFHLVHWNWVRSSLWMIIEIDPKSVKVDAFSDDKGTDLTKGRPDPWRRPRRPEAPPVSKDGKACLLELAGPGVPAKGAREIRASGSMRVRLSLEKKTGRHKDVTLKVGAPINAGKILCSVSSVKYASWVGGGTMLTLRMYKRYPEIARFRFYDERGEEIPSGQTGSASRSGPGVRFYEKSFSLRKKAEKATVEVSYWADPRDVRVRFDVKASVGM